MSIDVTTIHAAKRAVAKASAACRAVQRELANVRAVLKDDKSPVTVADLASQAVVAHTLAAALGPIDLVGEEDAAMLREQVAKGDVALADAVLAAVRPVWPDATRDAVLDAIDAGGADPAAVLARGAKGYWTLDPIDGTKGFLRAEQYAVSLAWIEGGAPILGVLGCPNLALDAAKGVDADAIGTLYVAVRGEGALELAGDDADGAGRAVRRAPLVDGAPLRMCESVESGHTKHDAAADLMAHLGQTTASTRLDSQAKYAVVARGQADVYLRMPTKKGYVEKIWDHAAGALIAAEAGAIVSDVTGKPLDFGHGRGLAANLGVVVAPPEVHARLIEGIKALGLDRPPA
ncbi:3'(2'),5'-bisphosphate nucleotidase [Myxococcota bacterium]|nr:3'(2'),5'-bisphosphate nucleotidase [Myxococcota bacterium]